MKKMNLKLAMLSILAMLTLGAITITSCSKSDSSDTVKKGKVDDAVGTYKGKLYHKNIPKDYYDAIIIVTKEGSDKLRVNAKAGEEYSNITPRTFTVEVGDFFGADPVDVASLEGTIGGYLSYYGESKSIDIYTSKLQESELDFHFEGVKQ